MFSFLHGHGAGPSGLLSIALICSFSPWPWKPVSPSRFSKHSVEIPHKAGVFQRYLYHSHSSLESARSLYSINSINSINSTQLNSIQFNSIQFNSIQSIFPDIPNFHLGSHQGKSTHPHNCPTNP